MVNQNHWQICLGTPLLSLTNLKHSRLKALLLSTGEEFSADFTVAVKYVRREIRSLTEADRKDFFDALLKVYTVDADTGMKLYGNKFRTAEYFLSKHLAGAGTLDCDHWHDGLGIIGHHVGVSLEMEQSLQAVNPAVSLSYWEYGQDPLHYDNLQSSPIFGADMYGEMTPNNAEHKISTGMWTDIKLPDGGKYMQSWPKKSVSLNPYVNGYGQLRAPWNNNPSPFLGRHNMTYGKVVNKNIVPSCSEFQQAFKETQMSGLFSMINGITHGPIHIMIGGAWGQGSTLEPDSVRFIAGPDKVLLFKVLWRMGITRCPEAGSCSTDKPAACKCAIPQEYIDTYGAKGVLELASIVTNYPDFEDASEEELLELIHAIEDPGVVGDMFTSGASFDPTFWPLHGAAERLLGLKRSMISAGTLKTTFVESWTVPNRNSGLVSYSPIFLNGVCDWSGVKSVTDLTFPSCTANTACTGQAENDLLEFGDFL
eukprot:gene33062-40805_t